MNKHELAQSYSAAASTYDQAAFIEQEIGRRLLERLDYIKIIPKRILDLGCGTGYFTQHLKSIYPHATIVGLDMAFGMTKFASQKIDAIYCCADAEKLPFADQSFDLVFSNCCFPSIIDLSLTFIELNRVLNKNGLLIFSTYGPDSLVELGLDNQWRDMHLIGDQLLAHKFITPVVDNDLISFTYQNMSKLLKDLQQTGAYQVDLSAAQDLHAACEIKIEVIYGHALGSGAITKQFKDNCGNSYIPLDEILHLS